jgi:polysaccharide biosynthesis transport protein
MELKFYLAILRRRIWVILLTVLVATIASAVVSYSMVPRYKASTTIWVPTVVSSDATTGEIQLADRLINTYVTLATSGPVLRELEATTGMPAKELKDVVSAESIAQTELMNISATDSNPQMAARIATSLSTILIKQTLATKAGRDRRVSLFSPAGVPTVPTWMGLLPTFYWREINIVLGFVLGVIAAIALAFLYEYVDSTLYTREQIEATTELPTLVEIPVVKNAQPLIRYSNTLQSEAFRFLRTTIYFDHTPLPHTLLVTSALPGEGKSTVVANLALALAQAKRKVIVVDADLRLPTMHKFFGLSTDVGLTTVLRQESTLQNALQQTGIPGLQVITSGPKVDNPGEMLDSPLVESFLAQLRQESDFVLFDSPALLAVSDAVVISPLVAGVLLVVGQAQAYQEAVRAAQSQLNAVGANLMGIVVNRSDHVDTYFHRYTAHSASAK